MYLPQTPPTMMKTASQSSRNTVTGVMHDESRQTHHLE
jgi:hypothetical protein